MKKYANKTPFTRVNNRFEYYLSDLDCDCCANFRHRGGHGCGRVKCEFQDLRDECITAGRIKRKRGEEGKWRE